MVGLLCSLLAPGDAIAQEPSSTTTTTTATTTTATTAPADDTQAGGEKVQGRLEDRKAPGKPPTTKP